MDRRAFVVVVCRADEASSTFVVVRHAHRGWELPGGGLHAGEDAVVAARREFAEETGAVLEGARVAGTLERKHGTCWVVTGSTAGTRRSVRNADEPVVEDRTVNSLNDVSPLSFPDDPYAEIGDLVGMRLR